MFQDYKHLETNLYLTTTYQINDKYEANTVTAKVGAKEQETPWRDGENEPGETCVSCHRVRLHRCSHIASPNRSIFMRISNSRDSSRPLTAQEETDYLPRIEALLAFAEIERANSRICIDDASGPMIYVFYTKNGFFSCAWEYASAIY